jgi:hypothetical protein
VKGLYVNMDYQVKDKKSAVFVYIIHVVTIYGIDAVANEIDVVLKFFDS